MRSVDLHHEDSFDKVDLAAICKLMATIEAGQTNLADFTISEPNLGPDILHVSGVVVSPFQAHAWLLSQRRRRNNYFLGQGGRNKYLDCVYYGCPESVRA